MDKKNFKNKTKMCSSLEKVLFKIIFVLVVISEVGLVCCNHHHGHQHRKRHRSHGHHPIKVKPSCTEELWGINCLPTLSSSSSPCSWPCPPDDVVGDRSPICGSDGLLYDSRCVLEKEGCLLRQKRLQRRQFRLQTNEQSEDGLESVLEHNILEVDESGRKCVHFLEPLNQKRNGGQQKNSNQFQDQSEDGKRTGNGRGDDDGDDITSTTATTTHSVTNVNEPLSESGPGLMEDEAKMQSDQDPVKKEKICDEEDFEVFKEKLFDLTSTKWQSFNSIRKERKKMFEKEGTDKISPKWRQLLADGPEADKDHLIKLIFSSLDLDSNFILNYAELYQGDLDVGLHPIFSSKTTPTTTCQWRDFLRFQDSDGDDKIHVTEFYAAFSHLYGVTMISLEKALEWKKLDSFQGSDVKIYCDVLGSPPTPVIWTTPTSSDKDPHVIHEVGGSILILGVRESHGGNYSCKSVRNEEVVQHICLTVHKIGVEYSGDENLEQFSEDVEQTS